MFLHSMLHMYILSVDGWARNRSDWTTQVLAFVHSVAVWPSGQELGIHPPPAGRIPCSHHFRTLNRGASRPASLIDRVGHRSDWTTQVLARHNHQALAHRLASQRSHRSHYRITWDRTRHTANQPFISRVLNSTYKPMAYNKTR